MERFFKITTLEIKKKKFLKGIVKSFLLAIIPGLLLNSIFIEKNLIPQIVLKLNSFIILIFSSYSLTQEFSNRTDKIIFTGIFKRTEIMFSKWISFIVITTICFVFYEVISVMCNTFESRFLINNFITFIIYTFTISSFILLVSVITSNFIVTGITCYMLHFDLILVLFNNALGSDGNELIKEIIRNSPFYIANTGFNKGMYTVTEGIIMIGFGIIFFVLACVIMNRKNI